MRLKIQKKKIIIGIITLAFILSGLAPLWAQDGSATATSKKEEAPAVHQPTPEPKPETKETPKMVSTEALDSMKKEWEEVREQQIRMIQEKEDQLEKLKEELFAKQKAITTSPTSEKNVSSPQVAPLPEVKAPAESAPEKNAAGKTTGELASKEAELAEWEEDLVKFEAELEQRKESLNVRERQLQDKEAALMASVPGPSHSQTISGASSNPPLIQAVTPQKDSQNGQKKEDVPAVPAP